MGCPRVLAAEGGGSIFKLDPPKHLFCRETAFFFRELLAECFSYIIYHRTTAPEDFGGAPENRKFSVCGVIT